MNRAVEKSCFPVCRNWGRGGGEANVKAAEIRCVTVSGVGGERDLKNEQSSTDRGVAIGTGMGVELT